MPGTKRQKEVATLRRVFTGFAKTDRNNELIKDTIDLYETGKIAQLTTAENLIKSLIGTKKTRETTVKKIDEYKGKTSVIGRLETKRTFHVSATVELIKTTTHKTYTRKRTGTTVTREIPEAYQQTERDTIPVSIAVQAVSIEAAREQFMREVENDYTQTGEAEYTTSVKVGENSNMQVTEVSQGRSELHTPMRASTKCNYAFIPEDISHLKIYRYMCN